MKRPWREHLDAEELAELEGLEFQARVIDDMRKDFTERRRALTAKLNLLRNRGCGRARIAAGDINKGRKRREHPGAET